MAGAREQQHTQEQHTQEQHTQEQHTQEQHTPKQKEILIDIIDSFTFLDTKYISRQEYNKLKGNIIKEYSKEEKQAFLNQTDKNGKHVSRKDYILYLPEDLKKSEYASIIRKVNKLTFGEGKMPEYASVRELQVKILLAINSIFEEKKTLNPQDREKEKELNKVLSKFTQAYEDLFPGESKKLSDSVYRNKIMDNYNPEKIEEYKTELHDSGKKINILKTQVELSQLNKYHDSILAQHFNEAFFENGVNNLRFGLEIMTKGEQDLIIFRRGDEIRLKGDLHYKNKKNYSGMK